MPNLIIKSWTVSKVEAILIKVATLGLDEKHLGLSLSQVRDHLHKMVIIIYLAHQIQQSIQKLIFKNFCPHYYNTCYLVSNILYSTLGDLVFLKF